MRLLGGHLGGHLGAQVSALVDGQLPPATSERAWTHVLGCCTCRAAVEREIWVKNEMSRLRATEAPAHLARAIDRLAHADAARVDGCGVGSAVGPRDGSPDRDRVAAAWATVGELERRHRLKRVGFVAAGAGSVSAAMIGLGVVSGSFDVDEPRPAGAVIDRSDSGRNDLGRSSQLGPQPGMGRPTPTPAASGRSQVVAPAR
jgi:hypothetical protein